MRGEDVAFADSAAATKDSTSEGGPPTDVESFLVAADQQMQHPQPLLAATRAMAYRIRIIGRDRYPIAPPLRW